MNICVSGFQQRNPMLRLLEFLCKFIILAMNYLTDCRTQRRKKNEKDDYNLGFIDVKTK